MPNENDRQDQREPTGGPIAGGGENVGTETSRAEGGAQRAEPGRTVSPTTGAEGGEQPRKKQRRGFAAMDPEKQRAIASKGGKASHAAGTGHEWDSESAREAGRKGGQASCGGRGKLRPEGQGGGTPAGGGGTPGGT